MLLWNYLSHPSWVRGLKRLKVEEHMKDEVSHPSWVRGLKQLCEPRKRNIGRRTPRGCVD